VNVDVMGVVASVDRAGRPRTAGSVSVFVVGEVVAEISPAISRVEPIMGTNWKERRIARRRPFASKAKGACYKNTCDLGRNIAVKLVDVSETGIQLVAKMELVKNQEILILLEGLRHMRPIKAPGAVVWCVPSSDNNFVIGVRFHKYLAYRDFTYLT
jgi:hypothetical protein